MLLICHVIPYEHMRKGSDELTGESSHSSVTTWTSLVVTETEERKFLICHVTSSDHVNKAHMTFWMRTYLLQFTTMQHFMLIFRMTTEYNVFIYYVKSLDHITKEKCNLISATRTLNHHWLTTIKHLYARLKNYRHEAYVYFEI